MGNMMGSATLIMLTIFAAEPSAEDLRFFESAVRPLLVEQCLKCHGEKKQWSNLRLDSREAILKGGDTGPAAVPGKPEESLLIKAVRQTDGDLKMPKEGKLTERQIADLVKWVELGAPFPEAALAGGRSRDPNHWAFQPAKEQGVPVVNDVSWSSTPVDH